MAKVRLGDVAQEHKEACKENKSYPIIGLEHLDPEEIQLTRWDEKRATTFTKIFRKGYMLFGRRRAYLKKAALAPFDGICSGDITVIKAIPEKLLPELLPFVIQNNMFFDFAVERSAGSLSPRVKWEHLKNYEFELPDIDEQKRLAEVLWAMEDTKKAYNNLIQAADELVKAQFIEMFGVPGTDSKGWGLTKLGDICIINPRKSEELGLTSDLMVSFVAMPSVGDDGYIDTTVVKPYNEVQKGFTYFRENDVLFAKITPCMENGKGCVAKGLSNGIGFGSTEFYVLRPKLGVSSPSWIYEITMFSDFRKKAERIMTGTGGQRRVPISYLENYTITKAPFELQEKYSYFVEQTYKSKQTVKKALDQLVVVQNTLKHKTFS